MKNNDSSLDLTFDDTISIGTVRVVVDQSKIVVLATRVVNLEESNLCICCGRKVGTDNVSGILLCKYNGSAAQQKECGEKLHYGKTNERAYKKHKKRDTRIKKVRQLTGLDRKGAAALY